MKTLKILIAIMLLAAPAITFGQTNNSRSGSGRQERTYQKKSSRLSTSKDSSDVNAILKDSSNAESGPILNDNGNISTTGTIDGRSSTGRPDADTTGYSVKRSKRSTRTEGATMPDSTRKRRSRP